MTQYLNKSFYSHVNQALSEKVDVVSGKGLSQEDFTTALKEKLEEIPESVAPLDVNGKVPAANLPSYVDDVLEFANNSLLPVTGETGKIYVTLDNNKIHRWSGSAYIEISPSPGSTDSVPEGSVNQYFTNARAQAALAATVATINGRLNDLEDWRLVMAKKIRVFTGTTDASGKVTINLSSAGFTSAPRIVSATTFNNDTYALAMNVLSVSTTSTQVCFLREKATGVLLGGTITPSEAFASQPITIVAMEF